MARRELRLAGVGVQQANCWLQFAFAFGWERAALIASDRHQWGYPATHDRVSAAGRRVAFLCGLRGRCKPHIVA
jgi:hypothetical protein